MKDIYLILGGLLAGIIIIYGKKFILDKIRKTISDKLGNNILNKSIGELIPAEEAWDGKFIVGLTNIISPKKWGETLHAWFNLRNWIIVGIIVGVIFGYGYWKGKQGVQPVLDIRNKDVYVRLLKDPYYHYKSDGTQEILDFDRKTILKKITLKDYDNSSKLFRPYGLQLIPIGVGGIGSGMSGTGIETGAGFSIAKYFKYEADLFLTNKGGYIGVSHKLDGIKLYNTNFGLAYGKGYKLDTRIIGYIRIKF